MNEVVIGHLGTNLQMIFTDRDSWKLDLRMKVFAFVWKLTKLPYLPIISTDSMAVGRFSHLLET